MFLELYIFTMIIMYMKKLCVSDWLKTSSFLCNTSAKCKLQIACGC